MKITPQAIALSLYESLNDTDQGEWDGIIQKHIQYTVSIGKSQWLKQLGPLIEDLDRKKRGITKVEVTIGHEESKGAVAEAVEKLLPGIEKEMHVKVDPQVIGGMRVETEDQRWDFSMKKQLQKLAETIINE